MACVSSTRQAGHHTPPDAEARCPLMPAPLSGRHSVRPLMPLSVRWCQLAESARAVVGDGLDFGAVRVTDESAVVALVVLRPQPRCVQLLSTHLECLRMERAHGLRIGWGEGSVDLAVRLGALPLTDPELRLVAAVTHRDSEVHEPLVAEDAEHPVVERGCRGEVGAVDAEVVDHPSTLEPGHDTRQA